jgi:uncharacterized integral membrane protein
MLAVLVRDLVAEERTNRVSLESRAGSVITTAGALTTILFGLAALITDEAGVKLPTLSRWFLGASLVLLLAASVGAIFVSLPSGQREIKAEDLLQRIRSEDDWSASDDVVGRAIAKGFAVQLVSAREINRTKARLLISAIAAEVGGVAFIGAAVALILTVR